MRKRPYLHHLLWLPLCASLLSVQLFVPPIIGLANNGDFPKLCGRFSLGPQENGWGDNFLFFTSKYIYSPTYYWKSELVSSQLLLVGLSDWLNRAAGFTKTYDIRILGLLHVLLVLLSLGLLLRLLTPFGWRYRWLLPGLGVLIFTDVHYASYLNSFYMDAGSLVFLLLTVVLAAYLACQEPAKPLTLAAFVASALLFVTSKAQHAVTGPFLALFAAGVCWRSRRAAGLAAAGVITLASFLMIRQPPPYYSTQALFNLIFFKITNQSRTPAADLREFGLDASYLVYRNTHSFMEGSPANQIPWLNEFSKKTGYAFAAAFYLRHPDRALRFLYDDLRKEAPPIRAHNLSNFERSAGRPPGARATSFSLWTDLRTWLLARFPMHMVLWQVGLAAGALYGLFRGATPRRRALSGLCLVLVAMAVLEFGVASLADALETYRHLFLFHALTDIGICFAFAGLLGGRHNRLPDGVPQDRRAGANDARTVLERLDVRRHWNRGTRSDCESGASEAAV